jgi:hypothetical protein
MVFQVRNGLAGDRLFDRGQDSTDLVTPRARNNQEMHVLRHKHIGPKQKVQLPPGIIDGVREPGAGSIGAQKRVGVKACKSQFMGVAGFVHRGSAPASLGPVHGGSLRKIPQIGFAIILCESEPAISAGYFLPAVRATPLAVRRVFASTLRHGHPVHATCGSPEMKELFSPCCELSEPFTPHTAGMHGFVISGGFGPNEFWSYMIDLMHALNGHDYDLPGMGPKNLTGGYGMRSGSTGKVRLFPAEWSV